MVKEEERSAKKEGSLIKFSEIKREQWQGLKPYMDTCLLPVTGLTGKEAPWQVTAELELLRDAMEEIERRYAGRVVTYPAIHYGSVSRLKELAGGICGSLKEAGFAYVVLITANTAAGMEDCPEEADLLLNGEQAREGRAVRLIEELWRPVESAPEEK